MHSYSSTSVAHLRRRVNALKRKLAVPYAIIRITPIADDYAGQCSLAYFDHRPWPDFRFVGRNVVHRLGYRMASFTNLYLYLEGCRDRREIPKPAIIVATLLSPAWPNNTVGAAYQRHYKRVWDAAGYVSEF